MWSIRNILFALSLGFLSLGLVACDDDSTQSEESEAEVTESSEAAEEQDLPMVEVADDGTEFDPPVEKEQIPDGAWICDMRTVHYAQMEEGDAKCPLCNMDLVPHGDHDH